MKTETADQLLERAKTKELMAEESFQRSDTDGFLTQWSLGLSAELDRKNAEILKAGGAEFPALFDLEGNLVKAKLIKGKYGTTWAFVDEGGNLTGKFIGAFPKNRETMAKKGFVEGRVFQEAYADYAGGDGNVFITVRPAKPVYEKPLAIITTDRFKV